MSTMEFEELQKIWDSQSDKPLYAINEKALHNRILSKKTQASHIANFSESLLIFVNMGGGIFVFAMSLMKDNSSLFMYLLSAWMLVTTLFVVVQRSRRIKGERKFDRSILGDLNHAISNATYQVHLSQIMRWNILPIGMFSLLGLWSNEKPVWIIVLLMVVLGIAYFAGGWEHTIYKARKRELEMLRTKLNTEEAK